MVARTVRWHQLSDRHEPSAWLRDVVATITRRAATGSLRRCRHLTGPAGAVALWEPSRIVCDACFPILVDGSDADRTCDRCGAVVDRIHPFRLPVPTAVGLVVLCGGLCPDCLLREAPDGCPTCGIVLTEGTRR